MTEKTLRQYYEEHTGKVSDKWAVYLSVYERLFSSYRHESLCLLEIGVQNGGSLEIWSKYFAHAQKLIGCDINPDCSALRYDDKRISVIVGDANQDDIQAKILDVEKSFDLIIDDGSHYSKDIVRSFARYFPQLNDGGMYVVEDLHSSYWGGYEGGIFYPLSSMSFFKYLADIINNESWGVEITRRMLLERFCSAYEFEVDEEVLAHIHSIEFFNSICVIRKRRPEENILGSRIIAGKTEDVMPIDVLESSLRVVPPQITNEWSDVKWATDEGYLELKKAMQERDDELAVLNKDLNHLKHQEVALENELKNIYSSISWKITQPVRALGNVIRYFFR